ncbi:MAG: hypothetical protein LUE93_17160 [Bacteroides sp.]|nr:hypothetical protein [Bacteroides sp.]
MNKGIRNKILWFVLFIAIGCKEDKPVYDMDYTRWIYQKNNGAEREEPATDSPTETVLSFYKNFYMYQQRVTLPNGRQEYEKGVKEEAYAYDYPDLYLYKEDIEIRHLILHIPDRDPPYLAEGDSVIYRLEQRF